MERQDHWENAYSSKPIDHLGWYAPRLQLSLAWIEALALPLKAPLLDVGGGASTLVDDLLDLGYRNITVLDIAGTALRSAQSRLAERAGLVTWLHSEITAAGLPPDHFDLWHDRAVFHFLTERAQQQAYRERLLQALKPGRYVIIGVFAPEAPPRCSGLPVQRYTLEELQTTLGPQLKLMRHQKQLHVTPGGVEQMYQYAQFQRIGAP
jgi:SAM-dependent methyltransferase